ncbi:MAG: hypothetical protein ACRD4D_00105 [Candidatus Acidiferrales bacterium]
MGRPRPRILPALAPPLAGLAAVLLLAAPAAAAPLEIHRADFSVHLDPRFRALYATVVLTVRNAGGDSVDVLEFEFPAPLGPQAQVLAAWDREGPLEWRSDPVSDPVDVGASRELLVALRRMLRPGKKLVLGLRYEIALPALSVNAPAGIDADAARLATSGWYPLPARTSNALPHKLRLDVRLPNGWRVRSLARVKERVTGTALSHYSLELNSVRPNEELLRAEAPPGAEPSEN